MSNSVADVKIPYLGMFWRLKDKSASLLSKMVLIEQMMNSPDYRRIESLCGVPIKSVLDEMIKMDKPLAYTNPDNITRFNENVKTVTDALYDDALDEFRKIFDHQGIGTTARVYESVVIMDHQGIGNTTRVGGFVVNINHVETTLSSHPNVYAVPVPVPGFPHAALICFRKPH
jgi:hypothetical protein